MRHLQAELGENNNIFVLLLVLNAVARTNKINYTIYEIN
jgi:hypothetical protein